MSWYQPKSYIIEAKKLRLYNSEEIERFVRGDTGRCLQNHPNCMIFATKNGSLHVQLGQYVIKYDDGRFEAENELSFNRKYDIVERDDYGD